MAFRVFIGFAIIRKSLMISRSGKRKAADQKPCEAFKVAFDQVPQ